MGRYRRAATHTRMLLIRRQKRSLIHCLAPLTICIRSPRCFYFSETGGGGGALFYYFFTFFGGGGGFVAFNSWHAKGSGITMATFFSVIFFFFFLFSFAAFRRSRAILTFVFSFIESGERRRAVLLRLSLSCRFTPVYFQFDVGCRETSVFFWKR